MARNGQLQNSAAVPNGTPHAGIRFSHVLAAAKLDQENLGVYCREQGIYQHDIQQWEQEFVDDKNRLQHDKLKLELKKERAKNKHLERDLRRKEKALAEASALLVLKKKADAIWGEHEED